MKTQSMFPEAIRREGTKEKFLFLSQVIEGKKKFFVPMLASKNGVEEIDNSEVRGVSLPVYLKPWNTYIYTGQMETIWAGTLSAEL